MAAVFSNPRAKPARVPYGTSLSEMPDRTGIPQPPNPTAFGTSSNAQQRQVQRQERDREGQNALSELTEEQREEINEAVCFSSLWNDRRDQN